MALLVSITADAGQNATVGGSLVPLARSALSAPDDLIPVATLHNEEAALGLDRDPAPVTAILDAADSVDEIVPRQTMKSHAGSAPNIERIGKGDPAFGTRPTFAVPFGRPDGLRAMQWLEPQDDGTPSGSFSLSDSGGPLDGATAFAPWADGETMQDAVDNASAHDAQASVAMANVAVAMRPAALKIRLAQGATPRVSRAEALSSTTPAPAEGLPVAAVFPTRSGPQVGAAMSLIPRGDGGRPNYAALLTGERGARERRCLAEAVYFEARSEPEEGQAAVAQVVLNRATSGLYPASICGVVYQNRTHFKACQFSFACEGRSLRVSEPDSWRTATRIADAVLDGRTYLSDVGGATHYHANYVRPGWSRRLVKMDVIGHHIFYKLRRG